MFFVKSWPVTGVMLNVGFSEALAGRGLRIRRSEQKPPHALVRVKYRDAWFYIDETDQRTKRSFRLLTRFWTIIIASATGAAQTAPVLTVPVSR